MLSGATRSGDRSVGAFFRRGPGVRCKMMKNWGIIGGIAAALAAGIYVLWGPITDRKKRKKGLVPGLLNLGNTCFMNSLLQGLSACPSFIKWLEEFTSKYRTEMGRIEHRYLSVTLLQLLKALSSQESADDDTLDASSLLEVLRMYRWQISSFEEQDAHELFHVLTSSLEDERDREPQVVNLFDVQFLEVLPQNSEGQIHCRTQGILRPIPNHWKSQHPFHGRLTSTMICKHCQHQSPMRYDTFDSLSLSIPATTWGRTITLDHCLQHFISTELVKDVVCEFCTKIQANERHNGQLVENRKTFVKQLQLGKLPQCLCIHLQRLSWSNQGSPLKRNEHVQFGEFLILDRYKYRVTKSETFCRPSCHQADAIQKISEGQAVSDGLHTPKSQFLNGACSSSLLSHEFTNPLTPFSECTSPTYLFRLMAVIVHHGDMHSGHFVTYRRSPPAVRSSKPPSQQWLWISDDTVRKANLQEVLSSSAYLLFYERVRSKLHCPGQEFFSE
ncbi:ubiquitin carboxyl-terminal hydrolase 30 isoform X1 [Pelobates fuscus]|uniref:ubiquitin carboxyl-terminal hydrolase 30 isoform X1 n=2 Tax=Pelobates fuscus TaxID=191477 RepID=UPI002FE44CB1